MEQKIRYMTPQQYADMKQLPVEHVIHMMQPSRKTTFVFDSRDIDRTSPKHPRLVYRPRDAAGMEWPRKCLRRSVHVTGRGASMQVNPVEDAAIGGMAHPAAKNIDRNVALRVKGRKRVAKGLDRKRPKSKRGLGSQDMAAK
jgi:hypothetical protein